jgi:hypothetical protein
MIEDRTEVTEPDAAPATTSRWEDYVDVFFSPAELFQRRAEDRVKVPLLTLMALGFLFYFVMLPANRMIMLASIPDDPQAAEAVARMGTVFQIIGGIAVPFTYLAVAAIAALLLWLGARLVDLKPAYSRTMLIATYAAFVYLLAQIAGGVSVMLHGEAGLDVIRHTSFGPLRFVGHEDMNPVMTALLRRMDIFNIWQAVLWGIGIAVICRATRAQATITAAAAWLLFAIPGIIGATLAAMRG